MKTRYTSFMSVFFLFMLAPASTSGAADEAQLVSMINVLQKQIEQMQRTIERQDQKIRDLEKRDPAISVPGASARKEVSPEKEKEKFHKNLQSHIGDADKWLKDLKFSADMRLRYEAFDFTSGHRTETDPRNRFRFRLRYGFEKKFKPDMTVGFYLASGGTSDPTSTNESFDGNFVYKTSVIERVYATYTPSWAKWGPLEKFEITGGKFKNPFEEGTSEIIWDRDVRPEGAYQKADFRFINMENFKVKGYFTAGQFILDEDGTLGSGTTGGDAELWAFQFGIKPQFKTPFFEKPISVSSAVSYYSFDEYAEKSNFGTFARGNPNTTGSATELDAKDFEIFEYYAEIKISPDSLPPLRFFFDWATNLYESAPPASLGGANDAWAVGVKIGEAKEKGDWEIAYDYRLIEPNSVVGAFNDSDLGNGHSDKRGSVIKAKYMLTKNLELGLAAYFINNVSAGNILIDEEQRRFQVDLAWKF